MMTAIATRMERGGCRPAEHLSEFHSEPCSPAETRFRARLLLLLFLTGTAPLLSSFLPLKSEYPAAPPEQLERKEMRPGSLPQPKPSHESNQLEFRIARG